MGWGTDFNKDIYLNKQVYHGIKDVEETIQDLEDDIAKSKSELKMYAAANIKDLRADECDDVIGWLNIDVDVVLKDYEEAVTKLVNLRHYLEYLKEKEARNNRLNKFVKLSITGKNIMVGKRAFLIHW